MKIICPVLQLTIARFASNSPIASGTKEQAALLRVGDQPVEMALGAKFGVSRSTVREVLRELHEQRLVVHHPRTGRTVQAVGPREILEIYEVRAALEG